MSIFPEKLAIVGNGPSEHGTGNGPLIDSFDSVARFNNYVIDEKFVADYGKKVNFWAHCGWEDVKMRINDYDKVFMPFALYHPSWARHKAFFNHNAIKAYWDITEIMPVHYYLGAKDTMKKVSPGCTPSPSTGILFLYWIYREQEAYLNADHVFGFSFFDRNSPQHYFAEHEIPKKFYHHTGDVEKPFFDYMVSGSHLHDKEIFGKDYQ